MGEQRTRRPVVSPNELATVDWDDVLNLERLIEEIRRELNTVPRRSQLTKVLASIQRLVNEYDGLQQQDEARMEEVSGIVRKAERGLEVAQEVNDRKHYRWDPCLDH